jgi:uncharacterized protein YdhG (YjbR/CyaY superfamily)
MKATTTAAKNIDEYIAAAPDDVQEILENIRLTIRKAAPGVEEKISYRIPAFRLNGRYLIYFAVFKKHIGLYPAPTGTAELKAKLAPYRAGKATVQFPLDEPIPFGLISKMTKFMAKQSVAAAKAKGGKNRE